MGSSRLPASQLSSLQRELLEAFFAREQDGFFLTGGGALGGFHLSHRPSEDLDLFAVPPANLDAGERALHDAASACGAALRSVERFPDFRRFVAERGEERTVVDLVLDRAPQLSPEKPRFGQVRVDSLEEIAANKVCALLSRNEPKDLVDLDRLLRAGLPLEEVLKDAELKDAGVSPASLAFVLDQWRIGEEAALPGDADPRELERFRRELVERLARMSFPAPPATAKK